ncbi:general secretion pathway protein GspK [Sphingomonas montanisoli]|uniref:Type II secretion system protein K n=2 Tax=Sphingomonas montanisoli TaxID=2606412 RepID=A0A5D9CF78_9SPHN|nr:general secretion pathway protein GspK [Sphingomonas montanisoli]
MLAVDRLGLATRLAGNARAIDQARAYAYGGEALAGLIAADLTDRNRGDMTARPEWRDAERVIPVEGGMIRARLSDGGNCFNLNSVVQGDVFSGWRARPQGIDQFGTLLLVLGIPQSRARSIAAALGDWVDSDGTPAAGGAEDETYARATMPYRAANSLIGDPSELRTVAGVTPAIYKRVRPWICAFNSPELAAININTIRSDQAPLLAMQFGGRLSVAQAAGIIRSRPASGWESVEKFTADRLGGLGNVTGLNPTLDIRTRWFVLDLDVTVDGAQVRERALIDAGIPPPRVVMRQWGTE